MQNKPITDLKNQDALDYIKEHGLKPCPYCNSMEIAIKPFKGLYNVMIYNAGCNNNKCAVNPCTGYCSTEIDAIKTWNTWDKEQEA